VRKVDLSIELQILAFHAQRRAVIRVPGNGVSGPGQRWGEPEAQAVGT